MLATHQQIFCEMKNECLQRSLGLRMSLNLRKNPLFTAEIGLLFNHKWAGDLCPDALLSFSMTQLEGLTP